MRSLNELPFRKEYPVFRYRGYDIKKAEKEIRITFDFQIDGLCAFHPTVSVDTDGLCLLCPADSPVAREIVFSMGMVEAVSYLKCVCPERVIVECGGLDEADKRWWKKLWFHGLGEFFFRNEIEADERDFITIDAPPRTPVPSEKPLCRKGNLIPVGGGKDSCVTTELLNAFREENRFFTVNDQKARTDCVQAAGYKETDIVKVHRTISPELLRLNAEGFLNGHTPFSAVVAFTALYCAYLTGMKNIVLSNESSANEGNTGTGVNHQYSKSFQFEADFNQYVGKNISGDIRYFSLLRPFNELQIAKMFAAFPQYLPVFRSCNRGSKQNVWCEGCAKCLFVYGLLCAFLPETELGKAFRTDLFTNEELLPDFLGLIGAAEVKPFECVGTAEEYRWAIAHKITLLEAAGKPLPFLLLEFASRFDARAIDGENTLLQERNEQNLVPSEFGGCISEMLDYVKNH